MFKKTNYIFILIMVLLSNKAEAFDKNKVEILVNLYKELLITYCNAPNDEIAKSKRRDLINLFENPQLDYAMDLFNNEKKDNPNLVSYLRIISSNYENKILVDLENLHIFSCTSNIKGKEIAYASFNKSLKYIGTNKDYKNQQKNVTIVIGINISEPEYKINLVAFPKELISDPNCLLDAQQDNQKVLFEENLAIANLFFQQKNYVSAKQFYENVLLYKPNDSKIISQYNICNSKITYDSYQTNADMYISQENFVRAKEMYNNILNQFPEKREYAKKNIKYCDEQILIQNYTEYRKAGDDNFNKQFYTIATQYYQTALKYNPNDSYSIDMIKKCNNADKTTALNGISKARSLVFIHRQKYFPEIVNILTYYEQSGLLSGQDYYNLAAILDVAYENVNYAMNYSKRQSYHLAKEYCLKSMAKGYKTADNLWYDRFNKKARNI